MYPFPQFPRSFRSGGNGACGRCGRTHRKQFAGRRAAKSRSFAGVLRALCREGADCQNRSPFDFPHGNPVVGNRQSIFSPSGAQSVRRVFEQKNALRVFARNGVHLARHRSGGGGRFGQERGDCGRAYRLSSGGIFPLGGMYFRREIQSDAVSAFEKGRRKAARKER